MIEITVANMTEEKARIGSKTLEEYIKFARVGASFRMSRAQRKYVYANMDELLETAYYNERKTGVTISKKGMTAYNAITKHRDEVMYEGA